MKKLNRRKFIRNNTIALAAAPLVMGAGLPDTREEEIRPKIQFTRDGLDFSPNEYSRLLERLTIENNIVDDYSRFGVVERLEKKFATLLGKESAIFMPTGTLANHIALRKHAGENRKVLLQQVSHVYRDTGDGAQTLSGLHLVPLAYDKTSFTLEDVMSAIENVSRERVRTGVGAISIESPVRRKNNQVFDYSEMKRISEYASNEGIKMHLDGARLHNAVVHTGVPAIEFSSLFDTVYISMYKDFNAASGAILAGDDEFTRDLYHTRRMFGGGLPQVWPFAAVALHYADSFEDDYRESLRRFSAFSSLLNRSGRFKVEQVENGTNVFRLSVFGTDPETFRQNLEKVDVSIPAPAGENFFFPKTNNTLLFIEPDELAERFKNALE